MIDLTVFLIQFFCDRFNVIYQLQHITKESFFVVLEQTKLHKVIAEWK